MSGTARRKRPPVGGQDGGAWDALREELATMRQCIEETHREIAALRPSDGGRHSIARATVELDAIVGSTEAATHEILRSAERIADQGSLLAQRAEAGVAVDCGTIGEIAAAIGRETLNIMTACSFQDLTGQRTERVMRTLQFLQQRVSAMLGIWQAGSAPPPEAPAEASGHRTDADLMEGPTDHGLAQDDVDALFAQACG